MDTSSKPRSPVKCAHPSRPPSRHKRHKPTASTALWLDVIPPELSERIAAHHSAGKPTPATQNFILSSRPQQRAVLASFPRSLTLTNRSTWDSFHSLWPVLHPLTALRIFPHTPRHLLLYTLFCSASTLLDLTIPSQNVIRLPPDPSRAYIHLRRLVPNLRRLHIIAADRSLRLYRFRALCGLPHLRHLTLQCTRTPRCVFVEDGSLLVADATIATACPHLTSLAIMCPCMTRRASPWRIFTRLRRLRMICADVAKHAPEAVLPRMAELADVRLKAPNAYDVALQLERPVTMLCAYSYPLDSSQVAALSKCPRLNQVGLYLKAGAERGLAETVHALPLLRCLKLTWSRRRDGEYAEATPGELLRAVEAAPCLVDVRLFGVHVPFAEVAAIMKHMGRQLQLLRLPILQQDELPFDRYERLLYVACQNNSRLQSLLVSDGAWISLSSVAGVEKCSVERMEALRFQKSRLCAAARRLKQTSPLFESDCVSDFLGMTFELIELNYERASTLVQSPLAVIDERQ